MKRVIISLIPVFILAGAGYFIHSSINQEVNSKDILEINNSNNRKTIQFKYTDSLEGENIIIKSDKKNYQQGFNQTIAYFNVTNSSGQGDKLDLNLLFSNSDPEVKNFQFWNQEKQEWQSVSEAKNPTNNNNEKLSFFNSLSENIFGSQIAKASIKKQTTDSLFKKSQEKIHLNFNETKYFKVEFKHSPFKKGEFFVEAIGENGSYGFLDPWYESGWSHRQKLTIDHTKVDADLTDFPVYVDLADIGSADSSFFENVNSDCGDIRITTSDEITEVPREIVSCDTVAKTGELHFKAPNLYSSTDTEFYIYYGNSSASDYADDATYGAENVWTSNQVIVQHLNENPGIVGVDGISDSTSGNYTGTDYGSMDENDFINTQVGKGLDFDGVDDYVDTDGLPQWLDNFTIILWINADNWNFQGGAGIQTEEFLAIADDSTGRSIDLALGGYDTTAKNGKMVFYGSSGVSDFMERDVSGETGWHQIVLKQIRSENRRIGYFDGEEFSNVVNSDFNNPGKLINLGGIKADFDGSGNVATSFFSGKIDEIQIYNNILSSSWISTEYNNQNDASSFYTASVAVGNNESQVNSSQSEVVTNGLVGHWTFDGDDVDFSNNTVTDASGNGNGGTMTNMSQSTSPVAGKLGQAFKFNGVDGKVQLSDISDFATNEGSIAFWARLSDNDELNNPVTFSNSQSSVRNEFVFLYDYGVGDDHFSILINKDDSHQWTYQTAADYMDNFSGKWTHFVIIHNGTEPSFYINGETMPGSFVDDNDRTLWIDDIVSASSPADVFTVGLNQRDVINNPFPGDVDDVRIYNRVLSEEEIGTLYRSGKAKMGMSLADKSTDGLVGMWSFDGADIDWGTNTAYDRSGNGNNGTLTNGPSAAIGKHGQALEFDGTDDYLDIGDKSQLELSTFTISGWIKTSKDYSSSPGFILIKRGLNVYDWYDLRLDTDNALYFSYTDDNSGSDRIAADSTTVINDGSWHHFICIKNGSTNTIYIDGLFDTDNTNVNVGDITWGNSPFYIGAKTTSSDDSTSANFFDGKIDEVRIYNRALSEDEVADLYRLGKVRLRE